MIQNRDDRIVSFKIQPDELELRFHAMSGGAINNGRN